MVLTSEEHGALQNNFFQARAMVRAVVNKFEQARDEDTYCLAKTALEKLARINKLLEDSQLKAGEAKTQ